jgi:hypothetical protein
MGAGAIPQAVLSRPLPRRRWGYRRCLRLFRPCLRSPRRRYSKRRQWPRLVVSRRSLLPRIAVPPCQSRSPSRPLRNPPYRSGRFGTLSRRPGLFLIGGSIHPLTNPQGPRGARHEMTIGRRRIPGPSRGRGACRFVPVTRCAVNPTGRYALGGASPPRPAMRRASVSGSRAPDEARKGQSLAQPLELLRAVPGAPWSESPSFRPDPQPEPQEGLHREAQPFPQTEPPARRPGCSTPGSGSHSWYPHERSHHTTGACVQRPGLRNGAGVARGAAEQP